MPFMTSNVTSRTGAWLYSDTYEHVPSSDGVKNKTDKYKATVPLLNRVEQVPLLGRVGGITRMALSVIHIFSHFLTGIVTKNGEHFPHMVKGAAEFTRGMITTVPVIGDVFAWNHDPVAMSRTLNNNPRDTASFWVIKIYNPNKPDQVDRVFGKGNL